MIIYKNKIKISKLFILWTFYSITILISNFINQSDYYQGIGHLFIIGFFFLNISHVVTNFINKISITYIASTFICLIYSYVNVGFQIPFSGIFGNPNYSGLVSLIMLIASLQLYLNSKYDKKFLLFFIIFSFIHCAISESTTILVQVIIILVILLYCYFNSIKTAFSKMRKNKFRLLFGLILFIGSFICYFPLKKIYIKLFYYGGGITSFRTEIWLNIIKNISFFGHGENRYLITDGFGEHNIFLAKLNSVGVLPCVFLIVFVLYFLYLTYEFYKKDGNRHFILIACAMILLLEGLSEEFFGLSLTAPALFIILAISESNKLEGENRND